MIFLVWRSCNLLTCLQRLLAKPTKFLIKWIFALTDGVCWSWVKNCYFLEFRNLLCFGLRAEKKHKNLACWCDHLNRDFLLRSSLWRTIKNEFTHEIWIFGRLETLECLMLKPDFLGLMANEAQWLWSNALCSHTQQEGGGSPAFPNSTLPPNKKLLLHMAEKCLWRQATCAEIIRFYRSKVARELLSSKENLEVNRIICHWILRLIEIFRVGKISQKWKTYLEQLMEYSKLLLLLFFLFLVDSLISPKGSVMLVLPDHDTHREPCQGTLELWALSRTPNWRCSVSSNMSSVSLSELIRQLEFS